MSVNTPPTENIPIFDASIFPTASGTALTIASGSKYFLTYPVAQGSEIFPSNITLQSTLTDSSGDVGTAGQILSSTGTGTNWINPAGITGNLDLPPPYGLLTDTITQSASHVSGSNINLYGTSTNSDILIGSTLPAPQTVRICNTTSGSSGGSVHCSNIGFDGANINNATTPAAGTIKIGNSLTTGPLYIGCGSTTATHTTGPILIGSDSTATGGISIGTNSTTLPLTANAINIGSGTYTTNILGTSTMSGLITASSGLTATSGNITASSGVVIAPTVRNGANTGSISPGGIITGTSIIAPSYNASANADDVGICTNQTSGFLNIGTGARTTAGTINIGTGSGAVVNPINIGGAGSSTLLTGVVNSTNNLLLNTGTPTTTGSTSTLSGKISVIVNSGSYTISLANFNKFVLFVNVGTGGGGGTITLPPVSSATGYSFSFRSVQATATTTIQKDASDSNCILTTGASAYTTAAASSSNVISSGAVKSFMSDGTFWIQY